MRAAALVLWYRLPRGFRLAAFMVASTVLEVLKILGILAVCSVAVWILLLAASAS